MKRLGLAISSLTLAFNLHAELAALSPAGGASVPVQTEEELALASIHTYTGRVEKAKACKTPEDMIKLAKEEGYDLSEDELNSIAGGVSWDCISDCHEHMPCPQDH